MRRLAVAVGIVAALGLVVYAWGASLPVAHTATLEARFDAPPDSVWHAIVDVAAYPSWRTDVESVELLSDGGAPLAWREAAGGDRVSYVAEEMRRPQRFVARISDEGLPYGGRWIYSLAPDGDGTRLTITEEGEVYSPVFRFVSRYVIGQTSTMEKYLAALERRVAARS